MMWVYSLEAYLYELCETKQNKTNYTLFQNIFFPFKKYIKETIYGTKIIVCQHQLVHDNCAIMPRIKF